MAYVTYVQRFPEPSRCNEGVVSLKGLGYGEDMVANRTGSDQAISGPGVNSLLRISLII